MDDCTLPPHGADCNEDYTGSVCWAFWNEATGNYLALETLLDIEDFEAFQHLPWRIVRTGKRNIRKPRVARSEKSKIIYFARQLMGFPEGLIVDHINRRPCDDRRKNLRAVTALDNVLNSVGRIKGTSQYKGVAWNTKHQVWTAMGGNRKKIHYLGSFVCEVEAARAYNDFARKFHGPTAYLNPV